MIRFGGGGCFGVVFFTGLDFDLVRRTLPPLSTSPPPPPPLRELWSQVFGFERGRGDKGNTEEATVAIVS